MSNDSHIGSIE